jgi:hypothetical protein
MAMNKNLLIGIGVIGVGLFLSYRAKQKGQDVPFIGKLIPSPKSTTQKEPFKQGELVNPYEV